MRRMLIVLTGVLVLSGLVLAASYSGLLDRIEANRVAALNASLASIFPGDATGAPAFQRIDSQDAVVYRAALPDGRVAGYAVRLQAQGYGGAITLLVGVSADRAHIIGIQIVEQVETPGLGGRITEERFRARFEGLRPDRPIALVKNVEGDRSANEIQAISGATITSRAIVTGINEKLGAALDVIGRSE